MARGEPTICRACRADIASYLHVNSCGTAYRAPRGTIHAADDGMLPTMSEGALSAADLAYHRLMLKRDENARERQRNAAPVTRALDRAREQERATWRSVRRSDG